jgi:N-acetylmuramoyl-L-alanine amidase
MRVFVNPGHAPDGNPDPGAVNESTGLRECDVVLLISNKVSKYLEAVGYETHVLQSDRLNEICETANDWDADLFVSIHCNSAATEQANGTESWYCYGAEKGQQLAQCIDSQIVKSIAINDRGIKSAKPRVNGLYVLTNTNMPSVLAETAFISNSSDEKILASTEGQDQFARAIARGITDYIAWLEV